MLRTLILSTILELICFVQSQNFETYQDYRKHNNDSLLWGAYRPHTYFSVKPRYVDKSPFILGLMWMDSYSNNGIEGLRHFVEPHEQGLEHYGWQTYDPRIGGVETIVDKKNNLNLTVSLAKSKDGANWVTRVSGKAMDPKRKSTGSIFLYLNQQTTKDDQKSMLHLTPNELKGKMSFKGVSSELGKYNVDVIDKKGKYYRSRGKDKPYSKLVDASQTRHVSFRVPEDNYWKAHDLVKTLISESLTDLLHNYDVAKVTKNEFPDFYSIRDMFNFNEGNFHIIQKTFDTSGSDGEFEIEIIYNSIESKQKIKPAETNALITQSLLEIDRKFNKHFQLSESQKDKTEFVKSTLANLLGGIGYFYGNQRVDRITTVDEKHFDEIKLSHGDEDGPYSLFTSVPSRSQFPRGFYWDEGFHLLQIMEYDYDLAFEIISSWFNMIDEKGWVAREVILGEEARTRVPDEFITQNPNIANPPTILLAFSEMLQRASNSYKLVGELGDSGADKDSDTLEYNHKFLIEYSREIYPKLVKHFDWFVNSQRGFTEEYEGLIEENAISDKVHLNEIFAWVGRTNSHCLPSGLDDYPRSKPCDVTELHVDALSWVGVMARSLKQIATILDEDADILKYEEVENNVIENLELLHWSEKDQCFCDVVVDEYGEGISYDCHEGYVSLLPFALKLVPKESKAIASVLKLISDKSKLFSPYGLLSLSKQDKYFGQDENYWRGPIWLNINYLCLDALRYYFPEIHGTSNNNKASVLSKTAKTTYTKLSQNLIKNVYDNWKATGYCYENYSPVDGRGTGAKQFTGWTSLIVNIISWN
ncbi:Glycosyl hydrolase family 63 C-terminal domain [Nakaseomyces glabratus]|nr:Glycosyl hydrolase family 63 C-terminal domain [Nakaseomyces glabratus]KAH7598839.1 Glycosyl hydrolase family 63 C-terminal domain [Nakaseomyces glabratus]KAI8401011.1 Glycosyl hydrolase family 63 C-terminal domain [Nakaseomyces glabratus]